MGIERFFVGAFRREVGLEFGGVAEGERDWIWRFRGRVWGIHCVLWSGGEGWLEMG